MVLASACAHTPRSARLWLGGDVFLGAGGRGALTGIPAIVGGAPGIVNLEGPVGDGGARGEPLRLTHARGALAELRAAGVAAAGIANNHARDAGPDFTPKELGDLVAVSVQIGRCLKLCPVS